MISVIRDHPFWTIGVIWTIAIAAILLVFWLRARLRDKEEKMDRESVKRVNDRLFGDDRIVVPLHDGGTIKPGTPAPLILSNEHVVPKDQIDRWPMRNRFMGERTDAPSSNRMVQQILGDQAVAHEEPGAETDAPAPGEEGYEPPHQVVTVSVGQFSVHMMRDARPALSEARPDGAEWPLVEIPEEWAEPLVVFAMEVVRLREGWSVG